MSVFVGQKGATCDFPNSDTWVILSSIEQSIKRKIESVGTPLKDWDIDIYRGVLTGCNEAFIITTAKREEILANCKSDDERNRTEELIRPILRGRDIKRYGYDWANLWLINTHNGLRGKLSRIRIEDYPAVKNWLDNGGVAFNGKIYRGFEQIKGRSDHGDTPYNLRNCAYLEGFDIPKLIYPETTMGPYFVYDEHAMLLDKTCFMLISPDAKYIQATLSSKLFEFAYKKIYSSVELGEHGYQYNKHALIKLPIYREYTPHEAYSEDYFYDLYNLTQDERDLVNSSLNKDLQPPQ